MYNRINIMSGHTLDFQAHGKTSSIDSPLIQLPKRMRPPRLVLGPGGSLPVYSARDGAGQEMMYRDRLKGGSQVW